MRALGIILLAIGIIWLVVAFNMSTTVETGGTLLGDQYIRSETVHNIGLQDSRRNHITIAGLATLLGGIFYGFAAIQGGRRNAIINDVPPENGSHSTEPPCARDLTVDAYKIWLASKYKIAYNNTFGQFECNDKLFTSLELALEHAHSAEIQTLQKIEERFQEVCESLKKCITFDGQHYWYGGFRYNDQREAVAIAKIREGIGAE